MRKAGIDPNDYDAAFQWGQQMERDFVDTLHNLVLAANPHATVYSNSRLRLDREVANGSRPEIGTYTHIEVESLPTSAWGYNHYPLFAAYYQTLGKPLLGMTGIFHKSWADFGAIKPEAALLYECARMAASGAACSVGDQLAPNGSLSPAVYERLGAVYGKMEALEPWIANAEQVTEIGVLVAETGPRQTVIGREIDEGAMRMLLEMHRPFQFIDQQSDFSRYKVIIAPDCVPFDAALTAKIQAYLAAGGALLLNHRSGLTPDGKKFAFDFGVEYQGDAPHSPDFFACGAEVFGRWLASYKQVLYERGSAVKATPGAEVLAYVGNPYFTRDNFHYMSHEHTPYEKTSDLPAVTQKGRVVYLHSPLFGAYRKNAVPAYRDIVSTLLDRLAPERIFQAPGFPTTGEMGLLTQPAQGGRMLLHLIHAVPQTRGQGITVTEDIIPLYNLKVGVRAAFPVRSVQLVPGGETLPFETTNGVTWFTVPEVPGYQVVCFS